jgi:Arc/MetJ-type ribon-helix-helix transcriptional regulator
MTVQITVRVPDDLVAFADALVAEGDARSRADVVSRALRRERRRHAALADVEILKRRRAAEEAGDDLDALADFAARQPVDLDD